VLFHVGVLIVFFGHLVGLLTPISVFEFFGISHEFKQLMAIIVGGVAGVMALAGAALLLHRRLFDARIRVTSSFADIGILVLLFLQLLLGLSTIPLSLGHLDGSEMVKFMAWAQGIFTFDSGAAFYIADVSPVFKLHLFLGLTILLLFPFTRLVHMLSAPVRYIWRPGYQVVRARQARRSSVGLPAAE
jgi:nitrate reductase gamma subunit